MENKKLASFMFGDIEIKPIGKIFRCPFNCGDPRYPKPKWKTVNGIKRHLESCPNNPELILKREEESRIKNSPDSI